MCREHGQQLMQLAVKDNSLEGFELFGIIKETAVDDEGLTEFYNKYFPFPIYRDVDLKFYQALGDGKISDIFSYNPIRIFKSFREIGKRIKEKDLEGNYVGEGLKTGGVIVFGADSDPKYMAVEQTGTALDEEALLAAVKAVRDMSISVEL